MKVVDWLYGYVRSRHSYVTINDLLNTGTQGVRFRRISSRRNGSLYGFRYEALSLHERGLTYARGLARADDEQSRFAVVRR